MSCKTCVNFVLRKDMTKNLMSSKEVITEKLKYDSGWYNIFKQDLEKNWGKENGCSVSAYFIPVGEEDKMEVCDGKMYEYDSQKN